jgi:hypothetical protein
VLTLRPLLVAPAKAHVLATHRRLPRLAGAMWAVGCFAGKRLVGVAVIGRPNARVADTLGRLQVLRVAVEEGNRNACSMLYGACARAARAMGCVDLWTFIHEDETGVSLVAAGWIRDGFVSKGGEWNRRSRRRLKARESGAKQRWCAPWSAMLQKPATAQRCA